jgi:5-methylcytosine-specific restriction enzyme subunit McrC
MQLRSGVEIRATSWVGRITLGRLAITVRPKIQGAPFLSLLRYAYSMRNLDTYTTTGYGTATDSFEDLIVEQLANEAAELLSRGLHRDYLRFNAALGSPSGRIDFGQMVHATAAARSAVVCTYYNRSDAVLLNRVLLAGLRLATRASADNQLCARVSRLAQILEATVPRIVLTQADIDKARQIVDRRTTAYSSALILIEILAKGMGISLAEENDAAQLPGFLFDMNRFFQALISRFLKEELTGFSIQDEYQLRGIFEYDPANNPQRRRAVVPRPDFLVTSSGQVKEFLDAKYRDLWTNALPPNMLYQLVIYALSKSTGAPRSTILYPTLAAEASDQVLLLKDPVLGHKRAEVTLRPVNLLAMEKLIRPRQGAVAARQRQQLASELAFGSSTGTE